MLQLVFNIELYIGAIIYCLHLIPSPMVMILGLSPHPQQTTNTSNNMFMAASQDSVDLDGGC